MKLPPLDTRTWEAAAAKSGRGSFGFMRTAAHTHRGVDVTVPRFTQVRATTAGVVTHAANELGANFSGYGRHVAVKTDDGVWLLFAHLESAWVKPGDVVKANTVIGTVGDSCFERGNPSLACEGVHLHFEVSPTPYPQDSEAPRLDPLAWLADSKSPAVFPDVETSKPLPRARRGVTSKRQTKRRRTSEGNGSAIGAVVTLGAGLIFTILMLRRRSYA